MGLTDIGSREWSPYALRAHPSGPLGRSSRALSVETVPMGGRIHLLRDERIGQGRAG